MRRAILILFAAALLLCLAVPALAGQKLAWREVSHLTQVNKIAAPDAKDHLIGVYQHQGVCLFSGGQQAAYDNVGAFDVYDHDGGERLHQGYGKVLFSDGSFILFKTQGQEYFEKGNDLPRVKGTGSFLGGTGRYQGIQGTLSFSGGYVSGLKDDDTGGDAVLDYTAEYTLAK
ncbi:MAG: hypothetical protein K9K66_16695 [Desulfarculaceae bacterium]|nr:hypothetical protein [Desulfarculaceae bacterium]MCF8072631.1 hypothetical protein [Desulfarculaceae bacterium]MCF8103297.1 hypothetical protein [Desulfarculaceae bacterium]MCF8117779.1 hypothetical protein [Desulfarculaceae bacterium]